MISNRKFGFELELKDNVKKEYIRDLIVSFDKNINIRIIDDYLKTEDENYWEIKIDTSCGHELASPPLIGEDSLLYSKLLIDNISKDNLLTVDDSCGMHIHADVSDFSEYEMGKLLIRWLAIEDYLFNFIPIDRVDNIYCLTYWDKFERVNKCKDKSPYFVYSLIKPKDNDDFLSKDRKRTLNIVNYKNYIDRNNIIKLCKKCYSKEIACLFENSFANKATIEFRMPESSLDSDDLYNWVIFFISFIDTAKKSKSYLKLEKIQNREDFIKVVGIDKSYLNNFNFWLNKRFKKFLN